MAIVKVNSTPLVTRMQVSPVETVRLRFQSGLRGAQGPIGPSGGPDFTAEIAALELNVSDLDAEITALDAELSVLETDVLAVESDLAAKADLNSPTFSGTPVSTTPTAGTNNTQIATTAFVQTAVSTKANTASPTFTGTPAAPTASAATNTTQIATTAFVQTAVGGRLADTGDTSTGAINVDHTKSTAGIVYGYTALAKGTSTPTDHIVGAQLNAYSLGSAARSVWGAALEAWTGDIATTPTVTATLIGIEPAVISQYHAQNSALVGVDVVFKNRSDAETAAKGGLGSNGYNRNSRAIYLTSQVRGTDGAYCGWRYGIHFEANSLDRTVDGLAVGINFVPLGVDATRIAGVMHLADDQKILLDTSAARSLYYSSGSIVLNNNSFTVTVDGTGSWDVMGAYKVAATQVVGARNTGWAAFTGTTNKGTTYATGTVTLVQLAERVGAIQAALVTHGLLGA